MSHGSDMLSRVFLMQDKTLVARMLLSGAAVEIPLVSATYFYPAFGGYSVELEMDSIGVAIVQWCEVDDLENTVRWMITHAIAAQDKLSAH